MGKICCFTGHRDVPDESVRAIFENLEEMLTQLIENEGVTDFRPIAKLCKKYGIENILVEQDNAPDLGDVFLQMKSSFEHLDPIVHI